MNIVQYFTPNRIIGFLEFYEYLMYCLTVLSFFLQYLTNAKNLISSLSVTSKATLRSTIISSSYQPNLERRILDNILHEVDILLQPGLSPFFLIGTIIDLFHWSGSSSLFQIELMSVMRLWVCVSHLFYDIYIYEGHFVMWYLWRPNSRLIGMIPVLSYLFLPDA
jgi:hypothetical protein